MNKYTGKSVFGGIAIGKIMVYEKGEHQVKRVKITDAEAEKNRYYEAVEIAFKQLGELHEHFAKLARLMRQYLRFIR